MYFIELKVKRLAGPYQAFEVSDTMDAVAQEHAESFTFWMEYVSAARRGYGMVFNPQDVMRIAINEWFRKIDQLVEEAISTQRPYFRNRLLKGMPPKVQLQFSDGKTRGFTRTLKIDERFHRPGKDLRYIDHVHLNIMIGSMIRNEGKVLPDPREQYL